MTEIDRIRNILIDYEVNQKYTVIEALDEIYGVCFSRSLRVWDEWNENDDENDT